MKLDFYISSLSGGGAEKVLITLAQKFASSGHDVSIISLEKRPQFYPIADSVTVYRYDNTKKGRKGNFLDYMDIRRHLKKSNADVSISFLSRCNLLVLAAALFSGRKVIVCDRNNPLKEHSYLAFLISNLLYLTASRVMVQTKMIKSFYIKPLQKKISVIENPLDTAALDAQIESDIIRKKRIISVGRLEAQKDFKTLIQAFANLASQYPEWNLDIFGDGDKRSELQMLIDNLNMQERIILRGRTNRPYYEMKKSSVFVLSSYYEGFPNVLCEAMYAGNLCISSDCISGPRELIEDGMNGWLFPVEDQKKLEQLLEQILSGSIAKQEESIRQNAEKTVKRLYLDRNIRKWEQLILRAAEKK